MATKIEKKEVLNIGGTDVEIRPLKIKTLRAFMKKFGEMSGQELDDTGMLDFLVSCVVIAMGQYNSEMADAEFLEEHLDMDDIYIIIETAANIKLGEEGNALSRG